MYLSARDLAIINSIDYMKKCQDPLVLKKLNDIDVELDIFIEKIRRLSEESGKLIEENRKLIEELDESEELD